MPVGLLMLVGKFVFLALLYLFLTWAFRGLFRQMGLEARAEAAPRAPMAAAAATPTRAAVNAPAAPLPAVLAGPAPSTPAPAPRARLVVVEAGQSGLTEGQVIELPAALTIGRADDNGLPVQDRFCSAHHALIFLHEGQRLLRDRHSTNGVFHNGRRVTTDVVLSDGDRINLGTLGLIYRAPAAE